MALGKGTECALPDALEWNMLFDLSVKQCVPSIVLDGLNKTLASVPCQDNQGIGKMDKSLRNWLLFIRPQAIG